MRKIVENTLVGVLFTACALSAILGISWVCNIERPTPQTQHTAVVLQPVLDTRSSSSASTLVKLEDGRTTTFTYNGDFPPANGLKVPYFERTSDHAVSNVKFEPTNPYTALGSAMFIVGLFGIFPVAILGGKLDDRRKRQAAITA